MLLAAHDARANLLGVSTVHGNASVEHTTYNTCAVLKAIGREDVLVIRGSSSPLTRSPCYAANIHGESGLGGVTLLPAPNTNAFNPQRLQLENAADVILAQPPRTVWLVATGPLTNVAKLIHAVPQIVEHLQGISIMGGAIGGHFTDAPLGTVEGVGERFGNWTPYAEFNIYADPEAAACVLENPLLALKMTLIPLDITHLCRGNDHVQKLLFDSSQGAMSRVRTMMYETLMFFSGTYRTQFGIMDGPPLHDPVAVYAVLRPEIFDDNQGERWHARVILEPDRFDIKADPFNRVGQTVIEPAVTGGIRIPRNLYLGRFWADINVALAKAEH